ncbi:MAG: hypothetical protein M1838_004989 [Thelocarpon superellum]|nr:MAG: hypothetical protein M1838_004989 [Thelocarpon superellum]
MSASDGRSVKATTASSSIRKRPRPTLSCLECRRKKLKCDRNRPCDQCLKSARPRQCAYATQPDYQFANLPDVVDEDLHGALDARDSAGMHEPRDSPPSIVARSTSGSVESIEQLQERIRRLELVFSGVVGGAPLSADQRYGAPGTRGSLAVVDGLGGTIVASSGDPLPYNQELQKKSHSGYLRVRGSKTCYYGQRHWRILFSQFDEVGKALERSFFDPDLRPMRDGIQSLVNQYQRRALRSRHSAQADVLAAPTQDFLAMVPARNLCDELVTLYLENYEGPLRVLHVPTFQRDYQRFWQAPAAAKTSWVVQLLAILAVASPFHHTEPATVQDSPGRSRALSWLNAVEGYIRIRQSKSMRGLILIRSHCLLLIGRQMVFVDHEITPAAAGDLVRAAMYIGLHREPTRFSQVSIFDAEMRRRLWATVVELDLQASMAHGFPTTVRATDFDITPPSNYADTALSPDMVLPIVPEPAHFTNDATSQVILGRSLRLRLRTIDFINNVASEINLSDIVQCSRELEKTLEEVPQTLRPEQRAENPDHASHGRVLQCVMLHTYLRRVLLALLRAFAMTAINHPMANHSRQISFDSCMSVLSYQHVFDQSRPSSTRHQAFVQRFLKADCYHAGLSICAELRRQDRAIKGRGGQSVPLHMGANHEPISRSDVLLALQSTLDIFLGQISHLEHDLVFALFLSLALAAVKAQGSSDLTESLMCAETQKLIRIGLEANECQLHIDSREPSQIARNDIGDSSMVRISSSSIRALPSFIANRQQRTDSLSAPVLSHPAIPMTQQTGERQSDEGAGLPFDAVSHQRPIAWRKSN